MKRNVRSRHSPETAASTAGSNGASKLACPEKVRVALLTAPLLHNIVQTDTLMLIHVLLSASRLGRRPKKVLKSCSGPANKDFMMGLSSGDSEKSISPSSASPQSSSGGSGWDYPGLARATLTDMFPPELMKNFANLMPGMMPPSPMGFADSMCRPAAGVGGGEEGSIMEFSSSGVSSESGNQISHVELNEWRQKQLEVMSKYMHTNNKGSPPPPNDSPPPTDSDGQISEVSSSEVNSLTQHSVKNCSSSNAMSSLTGVTPGEASQLRTNIYHISASQQQRLDRFKSYCAGESKAATTELMLEVQESIINSHQEHCYHQRPIINAASAELDAKEQVNKYMYSSTMCSALALTARTAHTVHTAIHACLINFIKQSETIVTSRRANTYYYSTEIHWLNPCLHTWSDSSSCH